MLGLCRREQPANCVNNASCFLMHLGHRLFQVFKLALLAVTVPLALPAIALPLDAVVTTASGCCCGCGCGVGRWAVPRGAVTRRHVPRGRVVQRLCAGSAPSPGPGSGCWLHLLLTVLQVLSALRWLAVAKGRGGGCARPASAVRQTGR